MMFTQNSFSPFCRAAIATLLAAIGLPGQSSPDLSRQIAEVMSQGPSGKAHQRFIHAKGIVCEGTFPATPSAAGISRAAHLQGKRPSNGRLEFPARLCSY